MMMHDPDTKSSVSYYNGEVIYIYAFDLAYDMKRELPQSLLGRPLREYAHNITKRSPRQHFFYRPHIAALPEQTIRLSDHLITATGSIKIFNVGAVSLLLKIPFRNYRLTDLVDYHAYGSETGSIAQLATALAEQALEELRPVCIRPVTKLGSGEAYTVFQLDAASIGTGTWLMRNRSAVAGLLTEEDEAHRLSSQEIEESTQNHLSYYKNDLVVIDWDAALLIDKAEETREILHIMEVANVQLLELGVYDRLLDNATEIAYRDVTSGSLWSRRAIHRKLRELRMDMARLSDELINITKFFGDWHLARIYQCLHDRFHLSDWQHVTEQKLKALAELYHLLQEDRTNLLMVVLEATIVLLFIVDLVLIFIHE